MLVLLDTEAGRLKAARTSERDATFGENTNYGGFREYRVERPEEQSQGVRFFTWLRRMTVDAFYTSPIGIRDLGYQGNEFLSEYVVPEEVMDFISRSSGTDD